MYITIKEIFRRFAAKIITEPQNILSCKGREKGKVMPGRIHSVLSMCGVTTHTFFQRKGENKWISL